MSVVRDTINCVAKQVASSCHPPSPGYLLSRYCVKLWTSLFQYLLYLILHNLKFVRSFFKKRKKEQTMSFTMISTARVYLTLNQLPRQNPFCRELRKRYVVVNPTPTPSFRTPRIVCMAVSRFCFRNN